MKEQKLGAEAGQIAFNCQQIFLESAPNCFLIQATWVPHQYIFYSRNNTLKLFCCLEVCTIQQKFIWRGHSKWRRADGRNEAGGKWGCTVVMWSQGVYDAVAVLTLHVVMCLEWNLYPLQASGILGTQHSTWHILNFINSKTPQRIN